MVREGELRFTKRTVGEAPCESFCKKARTFSCFYLLSGCGLDVKTLDISKPQWPPWKRSSWALQLTSNLTIEYYADYIHGSIPCNKWGMACWC